MAENISWYPGHMKRAGKMMGETLKSVHIVIEVVDARIPVSGRDPLIDRLLKNKKRIIALNKSDLADSNENKKWAEHFIKAGTDAVITDCKTGEGINLLFKALNREREAREAKGFRKQSLRVMVAGVPNAGKSSLINRMADRKSAETGSSPGVTKSKQWLILSNGMWLLDTPGILKPGSGAGEAVFFLAFCDAVREGIPGAMVLAAELIRILSEKYPALLLKRYKIREIKGTPLEIMENIALKRGFVLPGGKIDYERCAATVLSEFRSGKIGRITLERF